MKFAKYGCIPIDIKILMRDSLTRHKIGESVYFGHLQGFSYLSISGSRGRLIWENSSLIFKIGKTGLEKLNSLFYLIIKSMENYTIERVNLF